MRTLLWVRFSSVKTLAALEVRVSGRHLVSKILSSLCILHVNLLLDGVGTGFVHSEDCLFTLLSILLGGLKLFNSMQSAGKFSVVFWRFRSVNKSLPLPRFWCIFCFLPLLSTLSSFSPRRVSYDSSLILHRIPKSWLPTLGHGFDAKSTNPRMPVAFLRFISIWICYTLQIQTFKI